VVVLKAARTPSISSCSDDSCSVCSSDDGRRIDIGKKLPDRYGPTNRIVDDRVSSKKNKIKAISPKRRHKRPASPEKSRRVEPSTPSPSKRKDKSEKVTKLFENDILTCL
jgi:hypothetical protein